MKIKIIILLVLVIFIALILIITPEKTVVYVPAQKEYTKIGEKLTVIPNGRFITPSGKTIKVAPHPFGLTISKDGNIAVTANSGVAPISISIIKNLKSEKPEIIQIPKGPSSDEGVLASVFMGLAISPDNKKVYVAGGQENKIFIFDLKKGEKLGFIDCSFKNDKEDYTDGYIGDLVIDEKGKYLYAVDQIGFRVLILDLEKKRLIKNVKVGRYPFGIALSPDEKSLYVANVGMYEYRLLEGVDFENLKETAPNFPTSAFLSKPSIEGYETEKYKVPPLGDPNVPESFSVWKIDVENPKSAKVVAKVKTGNLVGEMVEGVPAVGGSSPNSVVASDDFVFVSNGNNDSISVINAKTFKREKEILITLDKRLKGLRGIIPFGLSLSPDYKTLYVAESGINAIGVIDAKNFKIKGHIPVGWFPSKVKVTSDNKYLVVANAKGYGSGPNGGKNYTGDDDYSYIGYLMKGTVSIIRVPNKKELKKYTKTVLNNNFRFYSIKDKRFEWRKDNPIPLYPGEKKSPIKYIVFISKENRTFDEVFGKLKGANGDPSLARYGLNVSFTNKDKTLKVENASIMVNHYKLAEMFSVADNFYVDSDVSADGHRWLSNTYPNEWVEAEVPASYGGDRVFKRDSKAPGIFAFTGSAGAIYPEDYNEKGSLWDHLERNNISFYNFGFAIMFEPASYKEDYLDTGMRYFVNYPLPSPLYSRTSRNYPTFNMAIPDQFRVERFIKEFKERWLNGKEKLPKLITIILPNDHGADERADKGYPFRESYMADNDLALGRIVEFLSHTKYWKNMAIFVTEDDAQGGVDHIDAHRSILMVISPYAKKGFVSKYHYSFGSIFKTFWNILGVPYLNQYDATANDLADMFTSKPDFRKYKAVPVDKRVFDPEFAMKPFNSSIDWRKIKSPRKIDDIKDMIEDSKEKKNWRVNDLP